MEEEFLIQDDVNEKALFLKSLVEEWEKYDSLVIHFLPTTGCNFKCIYCYQDGIDRACKMTLNDVKTIDNYLREYLRLNPQIKYLMITLHGGEPTYNWKIVPFAMNVFRKIADDFSLKLYTSIVSNGYLLTPEKAEFLKFYGWHRFQVTLDGPKEIHNRRRHLINGNGTFDCIVSNINYILDKKNLPSIDLRINFDRSNYEYVFELIDFLADKFEKEKLFLSFGNITQTYESKAHDYIEKQKILFDNFADLYIKIYDYASKKGFYLNDSYVFGSICTAKVRNSFIFSPDGKIYKCLSMVGRIEGIIGDWKNDSCISPSKNLFKLKLYEKCFEKKCSLIPICHADCRFDALINLGDLNSVFCRKEILEKLNEDMLYIKYVANINSK